MFDSTLRGPCLSQKGDLWEATSYDGRVRLSMTDATFRRHLDKYLEVKGIHPQTERERREARYKALMVVHRWSYWRYIHDPEVQVVNLTLQLQECDIWHGATKIG
jgi:DNA-binding transcriptional ArsR family regulator